MRVQNFVGRDRAGGVVNGRVVVEEGDLGGC